MKDYLRQKAELLSALGGGSHVIGQEGPFPLKTSTWIGVLATLKGLFWKSVPHEDKATGLPLDNSPRSKVGSLSDLGAYFKKFDNDPGTRGVCWEYALKHGIEADNPVLRDRINEAISMCPGTDSRHDRLEAVLWGGDKRESTLEAAFQALGEDEKLWTPGRGRPVKIQRHLEAAKEGLQKPEARRGLPRSASEMWKADLFVKRANSQSWFGVSAKWRPDLFVNKNHSGISIGVSAFQPEGYGDRVSDVRWDENRKISIVEIPWRLQFGEGFRNGYRVVYELLKLIPAIEPEPENFSGDEYEIAQFLYNNRNKHVMEITDKIHDRILQMDGDPSDLESESIDIVGQYPPIKQPAPEIYQAR